MIAGSVLRSGDHGSADRTQHGHTVTVPLLLATVLSGSTHPTRPAQRLHPTGATGEHHRGLPLLEPKARTQGVEATAHTTPDVPEGQRPTVGLRATVRNG